jgi:hypothetical protein
MTTRQGRRIMLHSREKTEEFGGLRIWKRRTSGIEATPVVPYCFGVRQRATFVLLASEVAQQRQDPWRRVNRGSPNGKGPRGAGSGQAAGKFGLPQPLRLSAWPLLRNRPIFSALWAAGLLRGEWTRYQERQRGTGADRGGRRQLVRVREGGVRDVSAHAAPWVYRGWSVAPVTAEGWSIFSACLTAACHWRRPESLAKATNPSSGPAQSRCASSIFSRCSPSS